MTVSDHYACDNLVGAIEAGLRELGKATSAVTLADLAPVDEFHIGGRTATEELAARLQISAFDRILDVGCGLGGAARFIAQHYGCRVCGIDLTPGYVETGEVLSRWTGLADRVSLRQANALAMPFPPGTFTAAYMLHAGMNIGDKGGLCAEVARVLRAGSRFAIYDVMRTGPGELALPVPWATTADGNAVAEPEVYRNALRSAGFEIVCERDRRDFALDYFGQQKSRMSQAGAHLPLGLHTLMGDRRKDQVRNMIANISAGRIAPVELIARKPL